MRLDASLPSGDLREVGEAARRLEAAGVGRLWSAETQHDPFLALGAAALTTERVGLGTAIAVAFARSPMVLAHTAWDLQRASRGRFVLGLGTQVKAHNERRFSVPWTAPAPRMREVVLALRAIWACWGKGERLDFRGRHYRFDLMSPFFQPPPIEHPDIPIHLAAVNATMCETAGAVADGLLVHSFHSPRYLRQVVLPAVEHGLRESGRTRAKFSLHGRVFAVAGDTPDELAKARAAVRRQIAFYASTRTYARVLAVHGWEELTGRLHPLSLRGEWTAMEELITDEMLEAFSVSGTWKELGAKVRARYDGLLDAASLYHTIALASDDPRWRVLVDAFRA